MDRVIIENEKKIYKMDEDDEDVDEKNKSNAQLADALSKVLRMSKKKKHGKSIVLSKAKLYSDKEEKSKKKNYDFEIEPDANNTDDKKENIIIDNIHEENDVKPEKNTLRKNFIKVKNLYSIF